MSFHCNIINLPIEILDLVYKYIPGMGDKLNLAKSHCVLGEAYAFHVRNIFKEIDIEDQPIEDWSDILSLCGSSVTSIKATNDRSAVSVAKLASMHCPNLEKFSFRVCISTWNQIKSLLLTLPNLSYIEIWNSYQENLSVVDTLLQMPKLKHLKLYQFNNHDLERVGKLSNLTKLAIINPKELIDFFRVIRSLKNIESLELRRVIFRMPKDLSDEQLLPKIELLKVYDGIFDMPLPYLPTLKNLTFINSYGGTISDVFGDSVLSYGKTLESLYICGIPGSFKGINDTMRVIIQLKALKTLDCWLHYKDCLYDLCQLENLEVLILHSSNITNRGAITMINGCKKLRHLNIRECYPVNSDMVEEAVAALQNSPPRSDEPFVLIVRPGFGKVDKSKLGGVLNIEYV